VASTGFFYPDEVAVAEELVLERLAKGPASGYHFVFAEIGGQVAGYASYGHIACTRASYDLYWIAVDPRHQGRGLGRLVLAEAEKCIRAAGGRRVYIETSNREQYQSTRGFYLRCGYECEAILTEFYGPGDDKVIYVKALA
jgi:GNAT superfamily N-acetyltransferase